MSLMSARAGMEERGGEPPTGAAGGDLGGTYPNPTVLSLADVVTWGNAARLADIPAFAAPAFTFGTAAAAGTAGTVVRSDATLALFDANNPAALGAAGAGVAGVAARRDHIHPTTGLALLSAANAFTGSNQFINDDTLFGAGAGGGAGSFVDVGSLGDPNNVYFDARGSGASVGFNMRGKGTGSIGYFTNGTVRFTLDGSGNAVFGSAAIATTATDGFAYLTSCAGAPTGAPTAYAGRVPMIVDTTNSKIWFRIGGSWKGIVVV